MLHKVNIGTSDIVGGGGGDAAAMSSAPLPRHEPPPLAAVEEHVQRIRLEVTGQRRPPSGYASRVVIPPTTAGLARVAALVHLLDQVRYWAVEEASTFIEEPSGLAETEAPEAVVACLCSQRPQLMAQALRAVQPMLAHRQTAAELRRVMGDVWAGRGHVATAAPPLPDGCDPLLATLAEVLQRHRGAVPLLVEALSCAAAVLTQARAAHAAGDLNGHAVDDDDTERRHRRHLASVMVALHETLLVHEVEAAMRRHPDATALQVEGVAFFAALVSVPWTDEAADDAGAAPASLADVVADSDGVLDVLQAALHGHRQHLCVRRGVLHVWRACAQQPYNRVALLRHGAYGGALQLLREVGPYAVDVWREVAETVGYLIPCLDALQRRSLALALRDLLRRRPQLEMLELVLALLLSLLTVVAGGRNHTTGGGGGAYALYASVPQPPVSSSARGPRSGHTALHLSPLQWHPSTDRHGQHGAAAAADGDAWLFLLERCAMPQLVSGLLAYLSRCEAVDADDAADMDRVCRLAEAALAFF
ncbi:hypothetical protein NESM_000066400 [Novymonas esmeraldas]|uniref:Uncharacterized protein n=1 Tax=Novymonas esmeraldas TaxID=1808958 RepID=A0AAW0F4M9_9TRYP